MRPPPRPHPHYWRGKKYPKIKTTPKNFGRSFYFTSELLISIYLEVLMNVVHDSFYRREPDLRGPVIELEQDVGWQ
jgi:hypothetical protein